MFTCKVSSEVLLSLTNAKQFLWRMILSDMFGKSGTESPIFHVFTQVTTNVAFLSSDCVTWLLTSPKFELNYFSFVWRHTKLVSD